MLHNGKHVCGKEYSIALFQEGSETLILLAADANEHLQWMNALNRSLPKSLRLSQSAINVQGLSGSASFTDFSQSTSSGGFGSTSSLEAMNSSSASLSGFGIGGGIHGLPSNSQKPSRMQSMLQVLEAVLDPTVISNDRGMIVGFNKASEELFGWRKDEVLGKNVSLLMPSMFAQFHDGYLERFKKTNDKKLIGKPRSKLLAKYF